MTNVDLELDGLLPEISASIQKMGLDQEMPLKDLCPIGWKAVRDKPGVGKAMKARVEKGLIANLVVVPDPYGNSDREHTDYKRLK